MNLVDGASRVKGTVMAQFNVPGKVNPATVSMTEIEKLVAKALVGNGLEADEAAAGVRVCRAQKPAPAPPGLPFGDSNWGGGDHHVILAMVSNPETGALEMWRCNEDGSDPRKMDHAKWINGTKYEMVTNPDMVGGLV